MCLSLFSPFVTAPSPSHSLPLPPSLYTPLSLLPSLSVPLTLPFPLSLSSFHTLLTEQCELWKRFRDFQQLSRHLKTNHTHSLQHAPPSSTSPFPHLVKTRYFGKRNALNSHTLSLSRSLSLLSDRFKETVVEERRLSAELLLQFATSSPHLASSSSLRHFLAVSNTHTHTHTHTH